MRVIRDKVLVKTKAAAAAHTTPGGLFVPQTSEQAQYVTGEVVAVGEKVDTVKPGETIHFNRFVAPKLTINGSDLYTIREDDVLAIE
jgi:co-chaperonin GroES (HSP10)